MEYAADLATVEFKDAPTTPARYPLTPKPDVESVDGYLYS
jgi:hypothetical protein